MVPDAKPVGPDGLAVIDVGAGPSAGAVVFSHGTPTWSYEWRHLIAALSPRFRCIAPDHLGFGRSPRPPDADYSPEAHARRFRAVIETLGLKRYTLVVHDFGGPIALDGALAHPEEIERVVIFNTIAWPFTSTPRGKRGARMAGSGLFRFLYRHLNFSFVISKSAWGKGPRPKELWNEYTSRFPDADSRELVLFALARSLSASTPFFQSLEDRLARLRNTPIRIVWGLRDNAFTPDVLARFQSSWPHASVTTLPDAGHWPHEEEPQRCVEEVARFLASAVVGSAA